MRDWLYYRIHVDRPAAADRLLADAVRPLVGELRACDAGARWHFLRFLDASGLHLRVRVQAEPDALDAAERAFDRVLAAAVRRRSANAFGKHVYAPETRKFGAGSGMRLAEAVFEASSDMVLAAVDRVPGNARVAFAAAHLGTMVGQLPRRLRPAFLHQYAWYWSGGPVAGTPSRDRAGVVLARVPTGTADPAWGEALDRYTTRYRTLLGDPGRPLPGRSDYFLLFHHVHLTNNRIGVPPAAEAAIARSLWRAGGYDRLATAARPA